MYNSEENIEIWNILAQEFFEGKNSVETFQMFMHCGLWCVQKLFIVLLYMFLSSWSIIKLTSRNGYFHNKKKAIQLGMVSADYLCCNNELLINGGRS